MNNVPPALRKQLASDPEYKKCALRNHGNCDGRITWEHAIIYAGKQVQERWAIVPLCEKHHGVGKWMDAGTMAKERNVWCALNRATDDELRAISKVVNWIRERTRLNEKYGVYRV